MIWQIKVMLKSNLICWMKQLSGLYSIYRKEFFHSIESDYMMFTKYVFCVLSRHLQLLIQIGIIKRIIGFSNLPWPFSSALYRCFHSRENVTFLLSKFCLWDKQAVSDADSVKSKWSMPVMPKHSQTALTEKHNLIIFAEHSYDFSRNSAERCISVA